MEEKYELRVTSHEPRDKFTLSEVEGSDECVGSALILAVVLTSLLAIIGTVFLMVARVDKIATSAITENKELQFALESVVAEISRQLALDVPGNDPNQEYYDYPDPCNAWLAALEPYQSGGDYFWRQVSNVTGYIISPNDVPAIIIGEHDRIDLSTPSGLLADADGDGVSDTIWIELNNGMATSKGKPVFVAVRLIDNGGMLNVNTAYKFDPNEVNSQRIDGSSQTQINLLALSLRGLNPNADPNLLWYRCGAEPTDISAYEQNVIWQYNEPLGAYTPFDISDELTLKNRFLVKQVDTITRIKELWTDAFKIGVWTPFDSNLPGWFIHAYHINPDIYDYRHIATTYNMDRIITPDGEDPCIPNSGRMLNVNRIETLGDLDRLYRMLLQGIDPNVPDINSVAAQLAVNIKDFRDSDPCVSVYNGHYGFEQPCVYISELAHRFVLEPPMVLHRSYAIELYKPYESDDYPTGQWLLEIESYPDSPIQVDWSGNERFHVILFEDPNAPMEADVVWMAGDKDPNFTPDCQTILLGPNTVVFDPLTKIELQRFVVSDSNRITVDSVNVPAPLIGSWWEMDANTHSFQRDITPHKCIRRLWDDKDSNGTLGSTNNFVDVDTYQIQAHPENQPFTGIGDIGKVFRENVYSWNWTAATNEFDVRLNLADPAYQHIFNYLTVMDPNDPQYGGHPATETRVKGRININTAPWFVIAQLPWMTPEIAQRIVDYRDTIAKAAFESIGELNNVIDAADPNYSIDYYSRDFVDQFGFPDLTFDPITFLDGAPDDFEERDLIFSRISNLVTVRSDVFTAYILVRIGVDGPQKRAIAILDRSKVNDISGKVKVIALHPVPDPR